MLGNRFRFCGWNGFRPHRNLVPPPELTADAPIAKFSVPRFVRLGEPAGMERQGFISLGCRGRATLAAWAWLGVLFRLQRTLSFPHKSVVADRTYHWSDSAVRWERGIGTSAQPRVGGAGHFPEVLVPGRFR